MALFSLPSAQEVIDDTRLRREQFNAVYTFDQWSADVTQKISEAYTWVEGKLVAAGGRFGWPLPDSVVAHEFPDFNAAQRAAWTKAQRDLATLITKRKSLGFAFELAGQFNQAYLARAQYFDADAAKMLLGDPSNPLDNGLVGAIGKVVADQPGEAAPVSSFSTTPRRRDGYSRDGECEYSRGSWSGSRW